MKIQVVISYAFACNKNKALHLQRVPILSILSYNIGSLAASGSTLLVLRQYYTLNRLSNFRPAPPHPLATPLKGGKFDHRPSGQRSCYATAGKPYVLLLYLSFLTISVSPIISTSTGRISRGFHRSVLLWL